MKKTILVIVSVLMSIALLFNSTSFAVVFSFETQFEYSAAERSWLTDLVVKEDMQTVDGLASRVELVPLPDTPYRDTPESFKNDVTEYCSLYSISESSPKAGYLYLFDMLGQGSDTYFFGSSDRDIKEYLQGNGIIYPADMDNDRWIMARALYTAMISGVFTADDLLRDKSSATLDNALISYITSLSGIDGTSLKKWLPESSLISLDEYILAASRFSLWTSGYDVTPTTNSDDVYRLVAVMTIEKIGISIDRDLPFEELKAKYTAALLGKRYGVSVSDKKLSAAIEAEEAPFYLLQLIGQKEAGLSIRSENMSYEDAFYAVAKNTSFFDLENGEFYADIYNYEARLSKKRSSVWLYPTAYETGNEGADVRITANGKTVKNNYFTEISLNPSLDVEYVVITVKCTVEGKSYSSVYTLKIYQGTDSSASEEPSSESGKYLSSETIVAEIFASVGMNTAVTDLIEDFFTLLPPEMKSTMSIIAPTFDGDSEKAEAQQNPVKVENDSYFISVLDKIGKLVDSDIMGIAGASFDDKYTSDKFSFDYITFS